MNSWFGMSIFVALNLFQVVYVTAFSDPFLFSSLSNLWHKTYVWHINIRLTYKYRFVIKLYIFIHRIWICISDHNWLFYFLGQHGCSVMMLRNNLLFLLLIFISLQNAQAGDTAALNFCFNATFEGENLRLFQPKLLHLNYFTPLLTRGRKND